MTTFCAFFIYCLSLNQSVNSVQPVTVQPVTSQKKPAPIQPKRPNAQTCKKFQYDPNHKYLATISSAELQKEWELYQEWEKSGCGFNDYYENRI
ncbi:MAG: hypothetical protein KME54_17710 [Tolypothrix brevis GSE-NOS-MK-07-07A]|nr:hypothetical protein [Tolypothrix brevis GSE-NOS-MK-07-07A]